MGGDIMKYNPLGIKTEYTLLSSLIKIKDLIEFAKINNITALGLLDDNLNGVMEFYDNCLLNNIKPLLDECLNSNSIKENIEKVKDECWYHRGESAKYIVDYMVSRREVHE